MTSEETRKLMEEMFQAQDVRLDKRLADSQSASTASIKPTSKSVPPQKNGLMGWHGVGIVVGVLSAITLPVLAVTWYAADRMSQLETVEKDLDQTQDNVTELQRQVEVGITGLREDVQQLREAFAAYTQTILPMIASSFKRPPSTPAAVP